MPPRNTLTPGQQRMAAARAARNSGATAREARQAARSLEPTLSADRLAEGVDRINPPVPAVNTNDGSRTQGMIDTTANNVSQFITSQSENAQQRDELASLLGEQTFDAAGQREQLTNQFGLPANLARLTDIQTQLAAKNTESGVTKTRIEGAAGQTAATAQREVTQEDRENAVRTAGLAAEAQVLQGNIETASTLINSAMQDYYQDRQLTNQNMINQLNYFSGLADEETAQLLRKEQRVFEADQANVKRVQENIDSALKSGAATTNEIKFLTDPKTTDKERLAMAQLIQARGAKDVRDLEMQSNRLDMDVKAEQLARLREPTVATRETSVVEVNGQKQLIDTQTGDVIATFGAGVSSSEIENARDANFVNTLDSLKNHPGMAKAVGTTALARFTPFRADVMTGQVSDFIGSVENTVKVLTLNTFAEAKEKGMTFGAMSEGEWQILGESATKIAQWRRTREDGSIYYDTSEKNMNKELDTLSNFGKMDALRKGVNPADIGVLKQEDGTFWTQNSDGSYTQLDVTLP